MTIIQKSFKKNLCALSTIMEKVALPRGFFGCSGEYYQRVFIKSSKDEKKLNSAHRPFLISEVKQSQIYDARLCTSNYETTS